MYMYIDIESLENRYHWELWHHFQKAEPTSYYSQLFLQIFFCQFLLLFCRNV